MANRIASIKEDRDMRRRVRSAEYRARRYGHKLDRRNRRHINKSFFDAMMHGVGYTRVSSDGAIEYIPLSDIKSEVGLCIEPISAVNLPDPSIFEVMEWIEQQNRRSSGMPSDLTESLVERVCEVQLRMMDAAFKRSMDSIIGK